MKSSPSGSLGSSSDGARVRYHVDVRRLYNDSSLGIGLITSVFSLHLNYTLPLPPTMLNIYTQTGRELMSSPSKS